MTDKHLISIEDFANVGPEHTAYPTTYKIKSCIYCDRTATKIVLYDVNNIIVQQRYCNFHVRNVRQIKK